MNEGELLAAAVSNLRDTFDKLIEVAADSSYHNDSTEKMRGLFEQSRNQFTLCFTLKNAFRELAAGGAPALQTEPPAERLPRAEENIRSSHP